jgi:hypothetical protein
MRRAGAHGGGRLPSSTLRGAKKRLTATVTKSRFDLSHLEQTTSHFSDRNKKRLFRFTTPARLQREFVDGRAGRPV